MKTKNEVAKTFLSVVAIALAAGVSIVYVEAWSIDMATIMANIENSLL